MKFIRFSSVLNRLSIYLHGRICWDFVSQFYLQISYISQILFAKVLFLLCWLYWLWSELKKKKKGKRKDKCSCFSSLRVRFFFMTPYSIYMFRYHTACTSESGVGPKTKYTRIFLEISIFFAAKITVLAVI